MLSNSKRESKRMVIFFNKWSSANLHAFKTAVALAVKIEVFLSILYFFVICRVKICKAYSMVLFIGISINRATIGGFVSRQFTMFLSFEGISFYVGTSISRGLSKSVYSEILVGNDEITEWLVEVFLKASHINVARYFLANSYLASQIKQMYLIVIFFWLVLIFCSMI